MVAVEVWEQGDSLSGLLGALLPAGLRGSVRLYSAGSMGEKSRPDLAVISPCWRGEVSGVCRCLLVPGTMGPAAGEMRAGWVVSYGLDRRDTLTLSSIEPGRLCGALQRELVTLDGTTVEGQEFPLSNGWKLAPMAALACVGVQLLLGVPPEGVRLEGGPGQPCAGRGVHGIMNATETGHRPGWSIPWTSMRF